METNLVAMLSGTYLRERDGLWEGEWSNACTGGARVGSTM